MEIKYAPTLHTATPIANMWLALTGVQRLNTAVIITVAVLMLMHDGISGLSWWCLVLVFSWPGGTIVIDIFQVVVFQVYKGVPCKLPKEVRPLSQMDR